MNKIRLDLLLVDKQLADSREKARALILSGNITVNGTTVTKAGAQVRPDAFIKVTQKNPYVSRGGLKLESALRTFHVDVSEMIAMDIGASTGGFTDCLLQHGAKQVYAIDVGYGQFSWKLRQDPRVVLLEKTNIRHLGKEAISADIDIATIDVSFISLLKVIPKVREFLREKSRIIALIKPQFEVARKDVSRGGVVRDQAKRDAVLEKISKETQRMSFQAESIMTSPLRGPKGNIEYFMLFSLKA